jgi:hypothetical protein
LILLGQNQHQTAYSAIRRRAARLLLVIAETAALSLPVHAQAGRVATPQVKSTRENHDLTIFLEAPIDIVAFKKKKGPSNSDSFRAPRSFYRPGDPGFFYQYMLFNTPVRYGEGERFRDFALIVYKFGHSIGHFYDTNEILAAIWCRLNDPDLGRANFVGTQVPEIRARFGEPSAVISDVLIYQRNARALALHVFGETIDWFKYVRLSRNVDATRSAPELLHTGPEW